MFLRKYVKLEKQGTELWKQEEDEKQRVNGHRIYVNYDLVLTSTFVNYIRASAIPSASIYSIAFNTRHTSQSVI